MKKSLLILLSITSSACKTTENESDLLDTPISETHLDIIDSMTLGGSELSGLAKRSLSNKSGIELMAVSDSSYKIQSVSFEKSLDKKPFFYDVDGLVSHKNNGNSQWEAVAADSEKVFILAEGSSKVFIFSQDLLKSETIIELKVPKSHAIHADWEKDTNSRGEGLVLLDNGHMLLLKEKNPVQLIEFGPSGESPGGFKPGDAVEGSETFSLPKNGTEFVPLKVWDLGTKSQPHLSDASDLAIGPNGKLFALSDSAGRIVALENVLKPSEDKFKVKEAWILPKKVEKAEGLAFSPAFEPIVVSDISGQDKNLFVLTSLD